MKINVLGVLFHSLSLDEAVESGVMLSGQEGFHYVVTPNPEFILTAKKNEAFRRVLNQADLTIPDGIGVIYAAKLLGTPLKSKVPGIEFAQRLMGELAQNGRKLYLLGAKPGVAEQAAENLQQRYPGLCICGTHDGYFQDDRPVVDSIKASDADVLFVCLGAPRQELWMAQYGPEAGVKLAVGLGGSLDVFAGTAERAPETWQKLGLEWLYRLVKEPKRIRRMIRLPLVLVDAALARVKGAPQG